MKHARAASAPDSSSICNKMCKKFVTVFKEAVKSHPVDFVIRQHSIWLEKSRGLLNKQTPPELASSELFPSNYRRKSWLLFFF